MLHQLLSERIQTRSPDFLSSSNDDAQVSHLNGENSEFHPVLSAEEAITDIFGNLDVLNTIFTSTVKCDLSFTFKIKLENSHLSILLMIVFF